MRNAYFRVFQIMVFCSSNDLMPVQVQKAICDLYGQVIILSEFACRTILFSGGDMQSIPSTGITEIREERTPYVT